MTVAERIKLRREDLKMTQDELATKLGLSDKSSISRIEKSGDDVTMKNVTRIATALSTTPKFLLGWEETPQENGRYTTLNHLYCILKRDKNFDDRAIPIMFGYDSEQEMLDNIKKQGPILIPYFRVKELSDTYDFEPEYLMGHTCCREHECGTIPEVSFPKETERKDIEEFIEVAKVSDPADVRRLTDLLVRLNNSVG